MSGRNLNTIAVAIVACLVGGLLVGVTSSAAANDQRAAANLSGRYQLHVTQGEVVVQAFRIDSWTGTVHVYNNVAAEKGWVEIAGATSRR